MAKKTILIAEDEQVQRESLAAMLTDEGYQILQAGDGKEAYDLILQHSVDVLVSDLRMPRMDGIALLKHMQELSPEVPVIMLTAYGTIQNTVTTMQLGAVDYLLKPVQIDDLLQRIQRALDRRELRHSSQVMTEQSFAGVSFENLVGQSQSMKKLFEMVHKLSSFKCNVLITGESGTGKDLIAQAIHHSGITRDQPFVAVNSGAIPNSLVESELFGYRKGAFTGATRDKVGYFEAADGGTLFLDEISALPQDVQCTLLRALENNVIVPVGDTHPRTVDVRVIAASNQDLKEMVAAGDFRQDLLYRLNVVTLQLPPLRHRTEDIPLLVRHFLDKYSREMNKRVTDVSNGAMRALLSYDWPGNIRELANVIEQAMIFTEGEQITLSHIPFIVDGIADDTSEDLKEVIIQYERQYIANSLNRHNHNKIDTAKCLGISLSTLYRKLDQLSIPSDLEETNSMAQSATDAPLGSDEGTYTARGDNEQQGPPSIGQGKEAIKSGPPAEPAISSIQ